MFVVLVFFSFLSVSFYVYGYRVWFFFGIEKFFFFVVSDFNNFKFVCFFGNIVIEEMEVLREWI